MGEYNNQRGQKKGVVIFLSPHPDDLEISASLLCRKLKESYSIIEIIMTDGASGGRNRKDFGTISHIEKRSKEATAAASIIGIDKVIFLNYPDGCLEKYRENARQEIFNIIFGYKPDIICFPSDADNHLDHQATNKIAISYLKEDKGVNDLQYCFWGKDNRINYRIRLNKSSEVKKLALREYVSQPIRKYIRKYPDIFKKESFYSERGFIL